MVLTIGQQIFKQEILKQWEKKNFFKLKNKIQECFELFGLFEEKNDYSPPEPEQRVQQTEEDQSYSDYLTAMAQIKGLDICKKCSSQYYLGEECRYCTRIASQKEATQSQEIEYSLRQSSVIREQGVQSSRTVIEPQFVDLQSPRLQNLNTWYASEQSDRDLLDAYNLIRDIIDRFRLNFADELQKRAMNLFYNIREYYKTNNTKRLGMKANMKALKLAYISRCIYYSGLSIRGYVIHMDEINEYISGGIKSKLPEATENIKLMFEGKPEYSFIFARMDYYSNLVGLKPYLSERFIKAMDQLFKYLKIKSKDYGNEKKEVVAMIYFIATEVLPKTEIQLPQENKGGKITLKLLEKYTNISTATISAEAKQIAKKIETKLMFS